MVDLAREGAVRTAAFAFLRQAQIAHPDTLPARVLRQGFEFDGERIGLLSYGLGINKPAMLAGALSVMTTAPKPGEPPPYTDWWFDETQVSYAYQGDDPTFWTNKAMRVAWEHNLPLVYLHGVSKGQYLAEFPVYITRDRPQELRVDLVIAADPAHREDGIAVEIEGRDYAVRPTKSRLHQRAFRIQVLRAYQERCAMCALRHPSLLDAAHIVPDGEPTGIAVTANGLSLCKIHHAAYDQLYLGIRPDLVVEVNDALMDEHDGPMLQHGLQAFHRQPLRQVPTRSVDRPDTDRLEWRYERFREGL